VSPCEGGTPQPGNPLKNHALLRNFPFKIKMAEGFFIFPRHSETLF
jgi:hypothetical protein